jgi:hypothetical protein
MNRPILASAFFALATTALMAQDASQSSPYQGTSNPPPDDSIITTEQQAPIPKPPAGHPMQTSAAQPAQMQAAPQISSTSPDSRPIPQTYGDGTDEGIVGIAAGAPTVTVRASATDPDSDIVHPAPLPAGMLGEGTMIRVRLLNEASSSFSKQGEPFRSRVATDVIQDGHIVIPAGTEIDGRVAQVSTGRFGGHGSILLQPDTITFENGSKFHMHAVVVSTPGSHLRVGSEGVIIPGSRVKRNSIEYGAVVGTGMIAGAVLGGPPGMLAGGLIGAGVVTTHLLVSHPQAHVKSGAVLMLTLTDQVQLVPASSQGN